jgi:hypothetical protein
VALGHMPQSRFVYTLRGPVDLCYARNGATAEKRGSGQKRMMLLPIKLWDGCSRGYRSCFRSFVLEFCFSFLDYKHKI